MSDNFAITTFSTPGDPRPSNDQMALRAKKKARSRANSDDEVSTLVFIYLYFLISPSLG